MKNIILAAFLTFILCLLWLWLVHEEGTTVSVSFIEAFKMRIARVENTCRKKTTALEEDMRTLERRFEACACNKPEAESAPERWGTRS